MIERAFFGKNTCLKAQFNKGDIYFQMGVKNGDAWKWDKLKFSDIECGDIVRLLDGKKESLSFFHKYEDNSNKAWLTRNGDTVYFKINDVSKGLLSGEQEVLKILLQRFIIDKNRLAKQYK